MNLNTIYQCIYIVIYKVDTLISSHYQCPKTCNRNLWSAVSATFYFTFKLVFHEMSPAKVDFKWDELVEIIPCQVVTEIGCARSSHPSGLIFSWVNTKTVSFAMEYALIWVGSNEPPMFQSANLGVFFKLQPESSTEHHSTIQHSYCYLSFGNWLTEPLENSKTL